MDFPTVIFSSNDLTAILSRFLGAPVVVCGGGCVVEDSPFREEQKLVENAVRSRRVEFFSGRHYAREALRQLGCVDEPILRGDKGNPLWPKLTVGSITHDLGQVFVAVTRSNTVDGFGLDLVSDLDRVEQSLQPLIASESELHLLKSIYKDVSALALAFSLKESVVKAISPTINHYLDFTDIELSMNAGEIFARVAGIDRLFRCGFVTSQNTLLSFAVTASTKDN